MNWELVVSGLMLDTNKNPVKNSESKVTNICEILRSTLIKKSSGLCGMRMVIMRREMDTTLSWTQLRDAVPWKEERERGKGKRNWQGILSSSEELMVANTEFGEP